MQIVIRDKSILVDLAGYGDGYAANDKITCPILMQSSPGPLVGYLHWFCGGVLLLQPAADDVYSLHSVLPSVFLPQLIIPHQPYGVARPH